MIKLLLLQLWPIWIPLLIYIFWWRTQVKKARKNGEDTLPTLKDGPWVWTLMATLLIAIVMFAWLGLSGDNHSDAHYQPARVVDGKVVDGNLHDEAE